MGIEWVKFDKNNLPEKEKPYLVTDGKQIEISYYPEAEWGIFDQYGIKKVSNVTYYISINLPVK